MEEINLNATKEQIEKTNLEMLAQAIKPPKERYKYRVVLEQISEEVIEVEAESELDAIELAIQGEGELVSGISFAPSIVHSEVLDD